jgi:hypothetical protein
MAAAARRCLVLAIQPREVTLVLLYSIAPYQVVATSGTVHAGILGCSMWGLLASAKLKQVSSLQEAALALRAVVEVVQLSSHPR